MLLAPFPFDLPDAHPHRRASEIPGLTSALPAPLISLVWWIHWLSCCQCTVGRGFLDPWSARERIPWSLVREGKPTLLSFRSPLPPNGFVKRSRRRKRTENRVKQRRKWESWVKGAGLLGNVSFFTHLVTIPSEVWRRKIKTGSSFRVGVQLLMLAFQNYV